MPVISAEFCIARLLFQVVQDVGQELNLLAQIRFQPRRDVEQVDVKVSSVGRRAVAAEPSHSWVESVTHVYGAPAHYCHLGMKAVDVIVIPL